MFVGKHYHLKSNKNCVGGFVLKIHFVFLKTLDEMKENLPPK
jgi:hypothetical protein